MTRILPFTQVYKWMESKTYGILGTIDEKGSPHSTSVVYGLDSIDNPTIYIVTGRKYKKTKNIKNNPLISFVIPFPHHILRFVPASSIQFQGTAEIIDIQNEEIIELFMNKRILRMVIKDAIENADQNVILKITPDKTIFGHGLGLSIMEMKKNHVAGGFKTYIRS
ncbi:MAG: pyridoxamine 5'-phosphate oxidase family protein [Candidatus Heimdallarchaeota archaeon]|nr:pyridoxamine 5'-phosphate oxidase family protein [Candidatus Heimdallarchaeota archaeon]